MSGILSHYSPEDVVILLGGIYPVDGLVDGSFVSIQKDSDSFSTKVTADGRVSRTHVDSPTHTVRISTMSTASVNDVFSAWAFADGKLYGVMMPLFVKDGLGTTLFYAPFSWIEKEPDLVLGTDVETREWTIKTAGAVRNVGGNELGSIVPTSLSAAGFIAADFAGLL